MLEDKDRIKSVLMVFKDRLKKYFSNIKGSRENIGNNIMKEVDPVTEDAEAKWLLNVWRHRDRAW